MYGLNPYGSFPLSEPVLFDVLAAPSPSGTIIPMMIPGTLISAESALAAASGLAVMRKIIDNPTMTRRRFLTGAVVKR